MVGIVGNKMENVTLSSRGRIKWIDDLKGFLLFVVICSHIHFPSAFILWFSLIYMQSFFFVSGLLYSERRYPNKSSFILSKMKSLLIPYLLFSLFGFFADPRLWGDVAWTGIFEDNVFLFLKGWSTRCTGTMWFVITLFGINIFYFFFRQIIKTLYKCLIIPFTILYALVMGIIGWLFYFYTLPVFMHIDTVCSASLFFVIGHLTHRYWKSTCIKSSVIIFTFSTIICIMCICRGGMYAAMFCNNMGNNSVIYVLGSFSGAMPLLQERKCFRLCLMRGSRS